MQTFYADLHVHIGRSGTRPVKMAASPRLTLPAIIEEAAERKGIHIVGIVDAVADPVFAELRTSVAGRALEELSGGGLQAAGGRVTIIPGAELEVHTGGKGAHYLAYFPDLSALGSFRSAIAPYVTNLALSSQLVRVPLGELIGLTADCDGLFLLAHVFTPHKGYYGSCAASLTEHLTAYEIAGISGVELGLSSDTAMADHLRELHSFPYLSNSDAHSTENIAREYIALRLAEPTFSELRLALGSRRGRRIVANYGLDPRLGKYYRTFCPGCSAKVSLMPDRRCMECGGQVVPGVYDRLLEIATTDEAPAPGRPPYIHQVPLRFIPGLGPAGIRRLVARFGTHMEILHRAGFDELAEIVGEKIARQILASRHARPVIQDGAGGRYGRLEG